MKAYLQFGEAGKPLQTVAAKAVKFDGYTGAVCALLYAGRWRRMRYRGHSGGRYVNVGPERVAVTLAP